MPGRCKNASLPFFLALLAALLAGACEDRQAAGCTFPTDCPVGMLCVDGVCQESRFCQNDADCGVAAYCRNDRCLPAESCGESELCEDGFECLEGYCLPREIPADADAEETTENDASTDGDKVLDGDVDTEPDDESDPPDSDPLADGDAAEDGDEPTDGDDDPEPDGDLDTETEPEAEEETKLTVAECWKDKSGEGSQGPDYDQYNPIVGSHCLGTNHQDITGIEKVVFLGDSITEGSPPTAIWDYYRYVLTAQLQAKFGTEIEVRECAEWGARVDDLLLPPHQQIPTCFPTLPEPKRTLVVMTIGGNDLYNWAKDWTEGATLPQIMDECEDTVQLMRDAIGWFYEDPARFPNGVFVITSNTYEYTDGTGDLNSCLASVFTGLSAWPEGAAPTIRFNEAFMEIAIEFGIDMIFMLENFCGHGFHNTDPASQCFMPPAGGERWFDLTCIHPNPVGHHEIARMFMAVVDE
ncbi:MAG: SGNH/GDSL hydrolase family protein [Myxococcales bacterium]|nr:MAG: SGNH/GDSL hydrolase family protein [Myxococcales bacterium]